MRRTKALQREPHYGFYRLMRRSSSCARGTAMIESRRFVDEPFQPGKRRQRPPLDRPSFQLPHDARAVLSFPQRPVHHDGAGGGGTPAGARLFAGQRQLRGRTRILQHQGSRRAADLAAATHRGGRSRPRRPQGDGHAADRQSPRGPQSLPARDRHRPRAVSQHHQGSGDLRALRARRRRPRLPLGSANSPMANS